jgi:hypothetical protein
MQKSQTLPLVIILQIFSLCRAQCKKEHAGLTITLYNLPLPVIQSYISNKWKLEFVRGGFIANYVKSFHDENVIWQISPNRIMENYNGNIYTDTTITWIRDLGVNTGLDSTFIMNFYDKRLYPYLYIVDGIFNDSLVLHDHAVDGQHYYFSKSN